MKRSIREAKYPRRKRPEYPTLQPGTACYIPRPSAGGAFMYVRQSFIGTNSKYQPHTGKKELARA